jgi:ABC-type sulfate transport system permease component
MVNTCQQVGGSIGTALLNTIAASALSSYLVTHGTSPAAQAGAAVHSYVVAFWVSAAIFAGAAVVCALVLRPGLLRQQQSADAVPVPA